MSIRATFHYFQGMECDMYSFYRIPKLLFTSEYFKNLSCEAKVLYGLMLDRMSLSIKNRWFDEEDRAYIFFSEEEIMEMLNCGRNRRAGRADAGCNMFDKAISADQWGSCAYTSGQEPFADSRV